MSGWFLLSQAAIIFGCGIKVGHNFGYRARQKEIEKHLQQLSPGTEQGS